MRDTIDMAREAGADTLMYWDIEKLKRFEALVRADEREIVMNEPINKEHWQRFEDEIRADEREACAKVCSEWSDYTKGIAPTLAERIRARGKA